jgi:hypothetical protein
VVVTYSHPNRIMRGVVFLVPALLGCNAAPAPHVHADSLDAQDRSAPAEAAPLADRAPSSLLYDLPADIRTHLDDLRARLGDPLRVVTLREVFVLVGPHAGPSFEAGVALARKALDAYFNGRFRTRPDRAVFAILFSSTPEYDAYCRTRFGTKCAASYGLYSHSTREIVLDVSPGLTTLTHELVHPIVQTDFPGAPAWIDEGLASLYENPTFPHEGEVHGLPNWRHASLVRALSSSAQARKVTLEALFAMSDADFHGVEEDLHYAMARSACRWLDSLDELWPFYREWRDSAGDPTGAKAFRKVTGKTPEQASDAWLRWLGPRNR